MTPETPAQWSAAGVRLLADHPITATAPFFLPAFLVIGVLVVIVVRDRRRRRREEAAERAEQQAPVDGERDGADRAA